MTTGVAIAVGGSPDEELVQASVIEVYEQMGGMTTYQLTYSLDISEGDIPLLLDGRLAPGSEIWILTTGEEGTACLVKGPVRGLDIHLQHGGAGSQLIVSGADTSLAMDREAQTVQWADVTDADVATTILSSYGYIPDVEPTSAMHMTTKHTLVQRDSDLRFIRKLARRNGYLFWLSCDEMGVETAHLKPPPVEGDPAAELVINLDAPTIESLAIHADFERPTSMAGAQLDLNSLSEIDGSVAAAPLAPLGNLNLQAITGDSRSVHLQAPADDAGNLQSRGKGLLTEADWFIEASCRTSVTLLGKVVRAHSLVHVRGAGSRYSGLYFVAGVRHLIDAVAHRMEITLVRNGWLA